MSDIAHKIAMSDWAGQSLSVWYFSRIIAVNTLKERFLILSFFYPTQFRFSLVKARDRIFFEFLILVLHFRGTVDGKKKVGKILHDLI